MFTTSLTTEAVQRYVRIGLQWLAAALVTRGIITPDATWVQPAIGFLVGAASFIWTLYGNRLTAKLNEISKVPEVEKVIVEDRAVAAAVPSPKVTT